MRLVISAGGTGGHVFPALAIIDELRKRDPDLEVFFVGARGGQEERLAARYRVPFHAISVAQWPRRNPLKMFWAAVKIGVGIVQSLFFLLRLRPQAVVGTGGYVSLPPVLTAGLLKIPVLLHEQNRVPGLANRLGARYAQVIALGMPDDTGAFPSAKSHLVGNPVREEILKVRTQREKSSAGRSDEKTTIFVMGGSQGAHAVNEAATEALRLLDPAQFRAFFMTGPKDHREITARLRESHMEVVVEPFFDDIAGVYCQTDLIVCRAGASTVAEITVMGIPSILVPYPFATDDHQRKNAELLAENGAAVIISNQDLTGSLLAERIRELCADPNRLEIMSNAARRAALPDAGERIVDLLLAMVFAGKELHDEVNNCVLKTRE